MELAGTVPSLTCQPRAALSKKSCSPPMPPQRNEELPWKSRCVCWKHAWTEAARQKPQDRSRRPRRGVEADDLTLMVEDKQWDETQSEQHKWEKQVMTSFSSLPTSQSR